jgi:DNA primase large subunit
MKLATVAELNANGWGPDRIIGAFRGMSGFDERKTTYFARHAIRTGYKPFRCTKIQEIGGCLGSECSIYRSKNR